MLSIWNVFLRIFENQFIITARIDELYQESGKVVVCGIGYIPIAEGSNTKKNVSTNGSSGIKTPRKRGDAATGGSHPSRSGRPGALEN